MSSTTIAPPPAGESEDVVGTAVSRTGLAIYLALGIVFGVILIKSEVVSWFRIQEMFRFQGFHMYGILGSAVAVAALSMAIIRKLELRTVTGEPITIPEKEMGRGYRYGIGGGMFGLGWALTGACPGPILALIGYGVWPFLFVLASALVGTWAYGSLRPRLPH